MPRSLHPNSNVSIVLDCDSEVEPKPTFIFRAPTMLDEEELGNAFDLDNKNATTLTESIENAIHGCLIEVQNMGESVTAETPVGKYLSTSEGHELVSKLLASGRLNSEEKKSSESQA